MRRRAVELAGRVAKEDGTLTAMQALERLGEKLAAARPASPS
jgi:hypothetical protein